MAAGHGYHNSKDDSHHSNDVHDSNNQNNFYDHNSNAHNWEQGCSDGFAMFQYGNQSKCGWANRKLASFDQAQRQCKRMGAHLAAPSNQDENIDLMLFAQGKANNISFNFNTMHRQRNESLMACRCRSQIPRPQ